MNLLHQHKYLLRILECKVYFIPTMHKMSKAMGSLVIMASGFRREGSCLIPDAKKVPPSTYSACAHKIYGSKSSVRTFTSESGDSLTVYHGCYL